MAQRPPLADTLKPVHAEGIDLFELDITVLLPPGSTDQAIYRFCNWTQTGGADVSYQGKSYTAIPIEAQGFERGGSTQLERPTLTVGNIGLAITGLVNSYGDLVGATVRRIRTLTCYLDGAASADPDAYWGPDQWVVEQKQREDKLSVTFQLAVPFDLENQTLPARRLLREQCQWIYKSGIGCGFIPTPANIGTFSVNPVVGTYTSDGVQFTATAVNDYSVGFQTNLTITSGGAPSGLYTVTQAGTAGFLATPPTTIAATGTWTIDYDSDFLLNPSARQPRFVITVNNHKFTVGQTVNAVLKGRLFLLLPFPIPLPPVAFVSGPVTITETTTNTISINAAVDLRLIFFPPISRTADIQPIYAGDFSGLPSTIRVTFNNHGIANGTQLSFRFPATPAANGIYRVFNSTTNTFDISKPPSVTSSGTVQWGGFFDVNDNAVFSETFDVCGKRLNSCKLRFGATNRLPFGGFPGLVDRQG